ncbi:hypothetical protein IEZ26_13655 [Nocardioides cavernae]|uniref:Baseplate assembly protein n=1 Tax=Nocardioides cavernae TaxID=1921566 RepID=A0ABR8NC02_9ACTN|nr:hypothetical protein [Nocardioides cavernae]MBD3925673.1 hypothetical protein [Nocardioides cavernae]MBM7513257.1 hypothetical protein [Nocardioides cavernae]
MARSLPGTDPRRAGRLRAELDRVGAATNPGWEVATAPDSFGRALLEIAAALAEVATTQLDRTAERDALAFVDTLDIPPPSPQAATATVILAPEESRTASTHVPARTQVGVTVGDEEVVFETVRALQASPVRITEVVAVDPGADHLERAPGRVVSTEPPPAPVAVHQVVTAASAGSTVLQVAPAIGLEPGDQVRILQSAYRVAGVDRDLVTLRDPLESALPAGTPLARIEALEIFTLRNLQEHAVYVGHSSLLNLEQPARIELVLTPAGLARRLAGLDLRYAMWGTLKGGDAPDWHALELVGGSVTTLTLRKRWTGTVEKVAVEGRKNRWLRIVHPVPITTVDVTALVDHVALKVASDTLPGPAAPSTPVGSTTITHAFHNAAPLAVTGRFLPFGPTPTRFDIFSLAAPEALSKPGARVDLEVRLADASLLTLVAPLNRPVGTSDTTAYGIGANGLPYSLMISVTSDVRWRVLPTPVNAEGVPVLLDGAAGLLAASVGTSFVSFVVDVLVARDRDGQLWYTGIVGQFTGAWQQLPADVETPVRDLVLVPTVGAGGSSSVGLLRVDGGQLQVLPIGAGGPAPSWETVTTSGTGPDLDQAIALVPVRRAPGQGGTTTDVVLAAEDGTVWFGRVGPVPAGLGATWSRLRAAGARADVRPAATHVRLPDGHTHLWVAWADADDGIGGWWGATDGTGGHVRDAASPGFSAASGSSVQVGTQPWEPSTTQPPTTAVARDNQGHRSVLVWFDEGAADTSTLPRDTTDLPPTDLLIVEPPAGQAAARPLLVLPATGEALVAATVDQLPDKEVTTVLHDGLVIRSEPDPSHYVELVGGQAPGTKKLEAARITHADDRVYEVPGGLRGAQQYRFLQRVDSAVKDLDGTARNSPQLQLDDTDQTTQVDHWLVVGDSAFHVITIVDLTGPVRRVATLDRPLPGVTTNAHATYTPTKKLGAFASVEPADIRTLVQVSPAVAAGDVVRFADGDPRRRVVAADSLRSNGLWWRLGQAWTTTPSTTAAEVLGDPTVGEWTVRALERGYDNPELSWEVFDGDGWRLLESGFVDGTRQLATSGTISFRVPATLAATEIGGREDLWIRARLVGGDYGRPKYVVTSTTVGTTVTQSTSIETSDLHPPEIESIEARFELDGETAPEGVLVVDNLAALDQTGASAADQARFRLFAGARAIDAGVDGPAIYVGLSRQPVSPLVLLAVADDQPVPGTLAVDALTAGGWRRATVDDETDALRRTGLVQVFLSAPLARATRFGRDGFWLRLRPATEAEGVDSGAWRPVVRGLFVNGVPATQARTVVQEILGSSLGEPSLVLELAEIPVLPETVELRVREELSEDEREVLEEERRRSVRISGRPAEAPPVVATVPGVDGAWVLWRRVDSFIDTDGDARVYRLDPGTGRVTFGDGRQGKVPPAGSDAVRAFRYQQGGGAGGNAPAWSDVAVKSALEGIESAVLPVDAAGGVDSPSPVALLHTAPARLRTAGRVVSAADYESQAVAAAAQVVRARCTPPTRPGDPIRVVIAVRDGTRRPVPSLALRSAVARRLRSAGWGGLPARRLVVEPPAYVAVKVTARLRASAALAAQVEQAATDALVGLLHPTDGGPDGSGWPFGRRLWESDVLRTLGTVDGIERVDGVEVSRVDGRALADMPADGLIWAAAEDVDVQVEVVVDP